MNWQNYYGSYGNVYHVAWLAPVILLLIVWTLVWKGLALWRAAHNESRGWFVVLLMLNTLGILEILYLYVFSKKKSTQQIQ